MFLIHILILALHTSRQLLDGRPLTDYSVEKQSCSHIPPGANTPHLHPTQSEAALSCTHHNAETRVAVQVKCTKRIMCREKLTPWCSQTFDVNKLRQTNSPVGFGLFALTVNQPQVILRLLRTGLGVQVPHADWLIWGRHSGQHCCCRSHNIPQRWVWWGVHHQASDGCLVSSFGCLWRRQIKRVT